jgi:hypothetical protein
MGRKETRSTAAEPVRPGVRLHYSAEGVSGVGAGRVEKSRDDAERNSSATWWDFRLTGVSSRLVCDGVSAENMLKSSISWRGKVPS